MNRPWGTFFVVMLGLVVLVAVGCPKPGTKSKTTSGPGSTTTPEDQPIDQPDTKPITPLSEVEMGIEKESYGKTPEETEVDLYTLTNKDGLKVKLTNYGATITSVEVPDRDGKMENVVLHADSLDGYLAGTPYFGCTVGRYANRIAKGKFTLADKEYTLAVNNPPDAPINHLHGGVKGFDKHVWKAEEVKTDDSVGVKFTRTSPDAEEGYPGALTAEVTYSLTNDNELKMDYKATTDAPTVLNLTNHSYWNLGPASKGGILDHELTLNADGFLPVDDGLIPLGKVEPVKDTPMDFTKPEKIGVRIDQVEGGYDHCYVLNRKEGEEMCLVAKVVEPKSGRVMEIFTSEPAVQFYSGNFLDGKDKADGVSYEKHHAFCLETQHYPDSPNQPNFPSTVLKPGETYEHHTMHKFSRQ